MKTTKADFAYFKARCEHWIDVLGINEWNITYLHRDVGGDIAQWRGNTTRKETSIILNVEWGDNPLNKKTLDHSALHEVVHLFLGEITCVAESRFSTKDEWDAVLHSTVNRLIKVLMK